MSFFRNPEYNSLKTVFLLCLIVLSGVFVFFNIVQRKDINRAGVFDLGGEIMDGAVLPSLLSSSMTTGINNLYDTENGDLNTAINDMGINMFRYLSGVESNYAHWDGPGMGMLVSETDVFGGTDDKAAELEFTENYNGNNGLPYTRFHDKLAEMSLRSRRPVVTYGLNIMTQHASGIALTTPIPIDTASIQVAITENVALIQNLISRGVVVESVQLCSECLVGRYNNAFPSVEHFIDRVQPIALGIKEEFPNIPIQLHIAIPKNGQADYGVDSTWNRGLRDANSANHFFDEIGTYLWLDGIEDLDADCNPDVYAGDIFECAKEKTRQMLDGNMQDAIDIYTEYFGGLPIRIGQYNINNFDQSAITTDFTGAAFENTFLQSAYIGEFLFKLAEYNKSNDNIVKSASIMNFSGQIKNLVSLSVNNSEDEYIPNDELYDDYYTDRPLKLNASGVAFKLIKDVFDGKHEILDLTVTAPNTAPSGDLQVYGFENLETGDVQYYFFNTSSLNIPIETIRVDGVLLQNATATLTSRAIYGSALSSSRGKVDEHNNNPFTLLNDGDPQYIIGTQNLTLRPFSVTKVEGLTVVPTDTEIDNPPPSSGGGGGGGSSKDECEDGKDNDNDDLEDYPLDPGCEDEDDDDETDEEGIGGDSEEPPTNVTPSDEGGSETPADVAYCAPYLTTYIQYGDINNQDDVKRLETFLNDHEGESLVVDGVYSLTDVEAVKRFQTKYASSVLYIWGITEPTGYVGRTTKAKINSFNCSSTIICPVFTEYNSLTENSISDEVLEAKYALSNLGFAVGTFSTTFDYTFHTAMIDFQETFHEVMLDPWGITEGTGYKYLTTNKYLNELLGCDTGPITIEGKIVEY